MRYNLYNLYPLVTEPSVYYSVSFIVYVGNQSRVLLGSGVGGGGGGGWRGGERETDRQR